MTPPKHIVSAAAIVINVQNEHAVKKFREIGYGNRWFIRTEFEHKDGTESEVKGFTKPFSLRSVYVRVWIGKKVMIIDSIEGIKFVNKKVKKVKIILGFFGY